jgi:hypothetical protein
LNRRFALLAIAVTFAFKPRPGAKALGIAVPPSVLYTADEVIK